MKTIEERANIHANKFDKEIGAHHYSYCIGATEQKAIDDDHLREVKKMLIDKSCEWLNEHTNWGDIYADGEVEELFRKAMEE